MRHWIVATALVLSSGTALAGQADVCYSAGAPDAQVDHFTSSSPLSCPVAGQHTLTELAQAGWSIVGVQPATVDYAVDAATQAPHSRSAWLVVIQRAGK